ncbi:MAG: hypothetical protein WEC59_03035 [Salibacteraceae bacterium]
MLKRILIPFLVLFACFQSEAETTIQGNAFYYKGKIIELRKYLDLFTFESLVIDRATIPTDGNFKFKVNVKETGLYIIKIEKVHAHIYLEPGNDYTLVINEPIEEERFNPAKDVFVLPEIYESESKLNYHITEIEKVINQFLIDNSGYYGRSVNRAIRPLADSLTTLLDAQYGDHSNAFLREHLHYRLAMLQLQINQSKPKVYETYFEGRKPAYNHLSFANAFNLFYKEYLNYLNPKVEHRFLDSATSALEHNNFNDLYQCLDVDPFLKDKRHKELMLASQLYELGREQRYPLNTIVSMLDSIIMRAEDNPCKIIAANAEQALLKLAPGSEAPDFEFSDVSGNIYRLSEYRGRYIYIQIFDRFDAETLKEMSLMKVLKDGYGSDIAMFSISTTESRRSLRNFSNKYKFDWYFGKAMAPEDLTTDYEIRAFPSYFYLNKEMEIIVSPAPSPGSRIEKMFAKAWNQEHPNKTLLFKLQPPEVDDEETEP